MLKLSSVEGGKDFRHFLDCPGRLAGATNRLLDFGYSIYFRTPNQPTAILSRWDLFAVDLAGQYHLPNATRSHADQFRRLRNRQIVVLNHEFHASILALVLK